MTSDNWLPLRIGAGGYLTGIDIAPDDTMVVRTDTYGAYIWNGSEWQQLVTSLSMPAANVDTGNAEGVYEIRIAPSNTNILYMEYLGQVYRSSDKGATWTDTNFAHVVQDPNDTHRVNGQKMAVDPINPDVVYAGTGQDGLFVTMNGGTSWDRVSALPPSAHRYQHRPVSWYFWHHLRSYLRYCRRQDQRHLRCKLWEWRLSN